MLNPARTRRRANYQNNKYFPKEHQATLIGLSQNSSEEGQYCLTAPKI